MRHKEPLAQMADMWRERCRKAERERDLARRDYECMNKFREHAEDQRDKLRETLELVLFCDKEDTVYARTKARAALKATEEG